MGKDAAGRAEPVQIKLRPRGAGIGFSDEEAENERALEEAAGAFKNKKTATTTTTKKKLNRSEWDDLEGLQPSPPHERKEQMMPGFKQAAKFPEMVEVDEEFFKPATTEPVEIIDMTSTPTAALPLLQLRRALHQAQQKLQSKIALNEQLAEEARQSLTRTSQEISRLESKSLLMRAEIDSKQSLLSLLNEFKTFNESSLEAWQELLLVKKKRQQIPTQLHSEASMNNVLFSSLIVPSYRKLLNADSALLLPVSALCQAELPPQQSLQLFYHCWWPSNRAVFTGFSLTDLQGWRTCIQFLEEWSPVLPRDTFQLPYLASQVLIPRLHSLLTTAAAEGISDVPGVFEVVSALQSYFTQTLAMPPDVYAQLVGAEMDRFTARMVRSLPLERCWTMQLPRPQLLQRISHALGREFVVDPGDQDISLLETILSFGLPANELGPILAAQLVPKLVGALERWLREPSADLEEVAQWYEAWRGLVDDVLRESEEFSDAFSRLLVVIDAHLNSLQC